MTQESADKELQRIIASFEKEEQKIPVFSWIGVILSALGTITGFGVLVYFILKRHIL